MRFPLTKYILKRILWIIPCMLGVLIIVFTITYFTPGDPVKTMLGTGYTPEKYAEMAHEFGLDKGYFGRLGSYIWDLLSKGSFGKSFMSSIPISKEVGERFPVTLRLAIMSTCIMVILGIPLGVLTATKQYSVLDMSLTVFALIFCAIPGFVLAILALVLFGVKLRWLPIGGLDTWKSYILPLLSTSLGGVAVLMRFTRTSMLEVIRQDYIRTARAKGLKEGDIIRKHALKNCLIPVLTVVGGNLAMQMGGAIIVETIYNVKGMGMYMMNAINSRDYPIVLSMVLLTSFIVCAMNLIVDIAYALVDPRIKAQYASPKRKAKLMQNGKKEVART